MTGRRAASRTRRNELSSGRRPLGNEIGALDPDPPRRGLLRLAQIIAPGGPIPVGRSTWWAGVAAGRFPPPVKLGRRITAWRIEEIYELIERGVQDKHRR